MSIGFLLPLDDTNKDIISLSLLVIHKQNSVTPSIHPYLPAPPIILLEDSLMFLKKLPAPSLM